jgi:hypothetical protein
MPQNDTGTVGDGKSEKELQDYNDLYFFSSALDVEIRE